MNATALSFASFGLGKIGHLACPNNFTSAISTNSYDRTDSLKKEVEILEDDNDSDHNSEKNKNVPFIRGNSNLRIKNYLRYKS